MYIEIVKPHKFIIHFSFFIFLTFVNLNVPTFSVFPCNTHKFHYNLTSFSQIQNTSTWYTTICCVLTGFIQYFYCI